MLQLCFVIESSVIEFFVLSLINVTVSINHITVDCPHPTCSGHGYCADDGTCICKKGWKAADCATMDTEALQCLPDCSGHGNFDLDTQTCSCETKWSGDDCSKGMFIVRLNGRDQMPGNPI